MHFERLYNRHFSRKESVSQASGNVLKRIQISRNRLSQCSGMFWSIRPEKETVSTARARDMVTLLGSV
jgi:hypothetical protein